jgi:hypothetical protein
MRSCLRPHRLPNGLPASSHLLRCERCRKFPKEGRLQAIPRGIEIAIWLGDHPLVTHFVILDDCNEIAHLEPHLVLTNSFVGLIPSIAGEVIRRLNAPDFIAPGSRPNIEELNSLTAGLRLPIWRMELFETAAAREDGFAPQLSWMKTRKY